MHAESLCAHHVTDKLAASIDMLFHKHKIDSDVARYLHAWRTYMHTCTNVLMRVRTCVRMHLFLT
jgi:hypothetical protein